MNEVAKEYIPAPDTLKGFPNAKPAKRKGQRKRWLNDDGDILEWDYQHGKIERYNKRGKHKGEFNPKDGNETKPADRTRTITPTRKEKMTTTTTKQAYMLAWFNKNPRPDTDEDLRIGAEEMPSVSPSDIRNWLELPDDDQACFCYDVTEACASALQQHVKHQIDLDQFDYSVDCYDPER